MLPGTRVTAEYLRMSDSKPSAQEARARLYRACHNTPGSCVRQQASSTLSILTIRSLPEQQSSHLRMALGRGPTRLEIFAGHALPFYMLDKIWAALKSTLKGTLKKLAALAGVLGSGGG